MVMLKSLLDLLDIDWKKISKTAFFTNSFTSALATQILKNLMPTLAGLFDANAKANACL